MLVKKDGRREPFDRMKVTNGIKRACEKRPISTVKIEELVDGIERWAMDQSDSEIQSSLLGERVMDELKKSLNLDLTEINIEKVTSKTKVAQKTLRKLEDRIANARTTMAVDPNQKITGNVLIIDDATGSGATLNETAKKILNITNAKVKIIGYTVVGSFKGFDVISEI